MRKVFLVVVSYLLYMNWKPAFALVLLGVSLVTFYGGLFVELRGDTLHSNESIRRKRLVWFFTLLGLFPLLIFKYYNFLNDSFRAGLASIGLQFTLPGLNWVVPIGISFYTFQAVGYLLDVYHGKTTAEHNLLDYLLFVSFFPQITSGPISTYKELMPQIKEAHLFSYEQGRVGLKYLLWGMFIKLVIADRVGMFVDTVYGNYQNYSGNICLLASLFYTIQIYCDFAGYSWMALGIAKTLGFNLINNFKHPYLATSISEFWRRWHISLTRWLTSNIYIAMGGNRCSRIKQYWNIIVTFLVSGLWHGANWSFVFWGVLHAMFLILEKILGLDPKGKHSNSIILPKIALLRIISTFVLVSFAWVFFRMPTIKSAFEFLKKMLLDRGTINLVSVFNGTAPIIIVSVGIFLLFMKDVFHEYNIDNKLSFVKRPAFQWSLCVLLFVLILATGVLDGGQFIYANF